MFTAPSTYSISMTRGVARYTSGTRQTVLERARREKAACTSASRSNCNSPRKPSTNPSICSVMAFRKGVSLPCGAQYWLDTSIRPMEVLPIRNSRSRLWRPILMITGTRCSTPLTVNGFLAR